MDTISGEQDRVFGVGVDPRELEELEQRLQSLATRLATQAQVPGEDALELHRRSTTLQRAAFVIRAELSSGDIDLRDDST